MKILGLKGNSDRFKKFRIPKNKKEKYPLIEITIDFANNEFKAKKVYENDSSNDDWIEVNDYTFPSSLLNNFIRSV